jgi:hypothetical protein
MVEVGAGGIIADSRRSRDIFWGIAPKATVAVNFHQEVVKLSPGNGQL